MLQTASGVMANLEPRSYARWNPPWSWVRKETHDKRDTASYRLEAIDRGGKKGGGVANPNPYRARAAKRRAHKPLNLTDVLKILTSAIREAERVLYEADDPEMILRCCHALAQATGQYSKLLEIGEFEGRLQALEAAVQRRNGGR